jgi:hypothetical protein
MANNVDRLSIIGVVPPPSDSRQAALVAEGSILAATAVRLI